MAFISELHYSNAYASSSGVSEFLEVTLAPGENPANFQVGFYNYTGDVGLTVTLNDGAFVEPGNVVTLPDGSKIFRIGQPDFNLVLTDPDGGATGTNYEAFALVDTSSNTVEQFWDIGGDTQNIQANDGPAQGAISDNIVVPSTPNAATYSVQFDASDPTTPIFEPVTPGAAVCFCSKTLIQTQFGRQAIGDIPIGTMVQTIDHGWQPVRWIGRQNVSARMRQDNPKLCPVIISAGALGNGLPSSDLRVSRQHRIAVSGPVAKRMFGTEQVLVAAKDLLVVPGVYPDNSQHTFTYVHIALDRHELIEVARIAAETLLPGPMALMALRPDEHQELIDIFGPKVLAGIAQSPARPLVTGARARKLIERHQRNDLSFINPPAQ